MKQIILYHNADLDGYSSGAITKFANPDADLYGINYGDEVPWGKIKGSDVFMVDFSLQPWSNMEKLDKLANSVTWIDHHKSAIEEHENNKQKLTKTWKTVLDTKLAACELCWEYFNPDENVPWSIRLLGRYDVWDLDFHPDVLAFQMGMRIQNWDPTSPAVIDEWDDLIEDDFISDGYIKTGGDILEYQTQKDTKLMESSFMVSFKGLKFLAVNQGGANSKIFDSKFDAEKHDAVMAIFYKGPDIGWSINMYSPNQKADLSGIAKKMGGGGHAYACGFQVLDIREVVGYINT